MIVASRRHSRSVPVRREQVLQKTFKLSLNCKCCRFGSAARISEILPTFIASHAAQSVEAGASPPLRGQRRRPFDTAMIEVDDSELTAEDHEFLQEWAAALQVTVAVLAGRILAAAIEGDQYVEKRPMD